MFRALSLLLAGAMLTGCVSVQASRSLIVPPREHATPVIAHARADCTDYFFILRCDLYMEIQEAQGTAKAAPTKATESAMPLWAQ